MRLLITNYHLINYAGSEINVLQLCLALRNLGIQADLGTFYYDYPMKELFEKKRIRVFQLFNHDIDLGKYDLLWTHHNVVLDHLVFGGFPLSNSKIIFSSLGSFEPLEAPPYYHENLNIILSNSGGNTSELVSQGVDKEKVIYFPNYAPSEFFVNAMKSHSEHLTKIAIISNHLPDELGEFSKLARSAGLQVKHIGQGGEEKFVDENLLKEFDLVISIGKTVQYCFALRIPVYCYDHFGGPGYIDKGNIDSSEYYNFSGRGIDRKLTGKGLFKDIVLYYKKACGNLDFLFDYAFENFNLEKNINGILELVSSLNNISLSEIREKYSLVGRRHKGFLREQERIKNLNSVQSEYKWDQQSIEGIKRENLRLQQEALAYALSKSWRYTRPFRKLFKGKKDD